MKLQYIKDLRNTLIKEPRRIWGMVELWSAVGITNYTTFSKYVKCFIYLGLVKITKKKKDIKVEYIGGNKK